MKTRCASVGPHPREVMMKHLKKVQLFRVGFDEKVSLEEKFFCWPWYAMKDRG